MKTVVHLIQLFISWIQLIFSTMARLTILPEAQNQAPQRFALTASWFSGEDRNRTPGDNPGKNKYLPQGGAESGANEFPDDLQAVIEAWPKLSAPIQAGILAMVKSAMSS